MTTEENQTAKTKGPATRVLSDVLGERSRQDEKWGEQNHTPGGWLVVLGEEFFEACKSCFDACWSDYREELVQVAATALMAIESFDRSNIDGNGSPNED